MSYKGREYLGIDKIIGPLVFLRNTKDVGYNELIEVIDENGAVRLGSVLETSDELIVAEIFEGTDGLSLKNSRLRLMGEPLRLGVGKSILGRIFKYCSAELRLKCSFTVFANLGSFRSSLFSWLYSIANL